VLSGSTKEWVAQKRVQLNSLMLNAAGIVRRVSNMKAALQQLAAMHYDVEVRHLS
jgi:aspartate oxidase